MQKPLKLALLGIALGAVALPVAVVALLRHQARQAIERGTDGEAWIAISDERARSGDKPLGGQLKGKLLAMAAFPRDAGYSDGFMIFGEYAIIVAKRGDGSVDLVYVYRVTADQGVSFLREFSIDRG